MESLIETATNIIEILVIIVGAASLIVAGLEKIAKITPTDKDDRAIGAAKRFLAQIIAVLDRLALNPDKDHARPAKEKRDETH